MHFQEWGPLIIHDYFVSLCTGYMCVQKNKCSWSKWGQIRPPLIVQHTTELVQIPFSWHAYSKAVCVSSLSLAPVHANMPCRLRHVFVVGCQIVGPQVSRVMNIVFPSVGNGFFFSKFVRLGCDKCGLCLWLRSSRHAWHTEVTWWSVEKNQTRLGWFFIRFLLFSFNIILQGALSHYHSKCAKRIVDKYSDNAPS